VKLELEKLQAWFGEAISHPLPETYLTNPLAVSLPNLRVEADARIKEKGAFSGFDRLGVYNQQYWFRLITIMQGEYPCTVHLLGLRPFNEWAVKYLLTHPPASPYLAGLDEKFLSFISEKYQVEKREPILQAIAFDQAFSKGFDAPTGLTIAEAGLVDPGDVMQLGIRLAPHVSPLYLSFDFATYRERSLSDETLEAVFELLPLESYSVIYRDADLFMQVKTVTSTAWRVLQEFRSTSLLSEVFIRLEGKFSESEQRDLESNLASWFQFWVMEGWLVLGATLP
jgi:hypothetical protein